MAPSPLLPVWLPPAGWASWGHHFSRVSQPVAQGSVALYFLRKPALLRFTFAVSSAGSRPVRPPAGGRCLRGLPAPRLPQSCLRPLPLIPLVPAHLGRGPDTPPVLPVCSPLRANLLSREAASCPGSKSPPSWGVLARASGSHL